MQNATRSMQPLAPVTYAERGVAVAFTAPMLAGTRLRRGRRGGPELILSSPSGTSHYYVVGWGGARTLCRPTVHDCMLYQRLSGLPVLTPAVCRSVSRKVAAEGYAGEAAQQAAVKAERDRALRIAACDFRLKLMLADMMAPGLTPLYPDAGRNHDTERRCREAVAQVAMRLDCRPATVHSALAEIARSVEPMGFEAADKEGRLSRLIDRMGTMQAALLEWRRQSVEPHTAALAEALALVTGGTTELAREMLEPAIGAIRELPRLLRRWVANETEAIAVLARLDWLLDGWDRICLLWDSAESAGQQRSAILEIAQLIPSQPRELEAWVKRPPPRHVLEPECRVTSINDGWRTGGAALSLISRNERLLGVEP
jgi:hypothetical protein